MPLRSCSRAECTRPADRGQGSCIPCHSYLCARHLRSERHACQNLMSADLDAYYGKCGDSLRKCHAGLVARIDFAALRRIASKLRGGVQCSLPAVEDGKSLQQTLAAQMGGQNCHVDIDFDDGIRWIARIRLDDPIQAPASIRDYVVSSEVATLRFLEQLPIPTARVHHYTLSTDVDEVGTPYMLMDKLEGHLLDFRSATQDQKSKILKQLASHSLALRAHPFDKLGSLTLTADGKGLDVGPYAIWQLWKDTSQGLGPFDKVRDAYRDILQMYLEFYRTGELDNLAIDNTLAIAWRTKFLKQWHLTSKHEVSKFYLKHQDDKGDHILVNDDFEITGILDWETATIEPEEVAFSSPLMLWPVGNFYNGKNSLAKDEHELAQIFTQQGEGRMSKFILHGRLFQRFLFFLGGGAETKEEFIGLFKGLRRAAEAMPDDTTDIDVKEDIAEYEEWKRVALAQAEPDVKMIIDQIKQRYDELDPDTSQFQDSS